MRESDPKPPLKLLKKHGRIENLPNEIKSRVPLYYEDVRKTFLEPKVTPNYALKYGDLRVEELYHLLCDQRNFSQERVETGWLREMVFERTEELVHSLLDEYDEENQQEYYGA